METLLMKGKPVADAKRAEIAAKIAIAAECGQAVTLAILLVGSDPASHVYKNRLVKMAAELGARTRTVELPEDAAQGEVVSAIRALNADPEVTGILPMMPLPKHLDADALCAELSPEKDVDCLQPLNAGELYLGHSRWAPCTPRACLEILRYYGVTIEGKNVVIVGRSNVVGKPVALLLLQENATVTICHSRTRNLPEVLRNADIIIAAVGKANFVTLEMVKEGAVVVDVGINAVDGKLVGDVDAAVAAKTSALTPVPGGVGVVSNMMVMEMLTRNLVAR